jgi:hypothetical protein
MTARMFILWLLLLALPAQGYAAATMMRCGPTHSSHQMPDETSHAGHDGAHTTGHAAHAAAAHATAAHATNDPGLPRLASPQPDFDHQCSACSVCCAGIGLAIFLPDEFTGIAPPAPSAEVLLPSPDAPLSRLDRPPCSALV